MLKWKRMTQASILTLGITTSAIAFTEFSVSEPEDGWALIRQIEVFETYENEKWVAVKNFPDALVEVAEDFEIDGFVVPIVPEAYLSQFILVEDPENCPFCGNSGYGPSLEVQMKRPLPDMPEFTAIRLRGTIEFNRDPETFQAVRLIDAVPIE